MTTALTDPVGVRSSNRLARFSPMLDQVADPLGYEAGDANLRRYVGNSPLNKVDPSGLAAEEKPASEASEKAKELEKILPFILDKLKQIAKDTKKLERFGVILKAFDPKAKPQYKFVECISKDTTESSSPFKWWVSEKKYGGRMLKPGPDGKVDIDKVEVTEDDIDNGYPIEFDWHTHPPTGDPWPSTKDGEECKKKQHCRNHDSIHRTDARWESRGRLGDLDRRYGRQGL